VHGSSLMSFTCGKLTNYSFALGSIKSKLMLCMHAKNTLCTQREFGAGGGRRQHSHAAETTERRESRARDGTETACTGTTPWARACRFPAHCLRATLQQGARETILLTPGPLSKDLVGVAPASLVCPWARTLVLARCLKCQRWTKEYLLGQK
jgi:hypothetical protein